MESRGVWKRSINDRPLLEASLRKVKGVSFCGYCGDGAYVMTVVAGREVLVFLRVRGGLDREG